MSLELDLALRAIQNDRDRRERAALKGEFTKHESTSQKGLFFWAEPVEVAGVVRSWSVTAQADGFPAGEAHDDWLACFKDADDIAKRLAKGEEV